jgi:uncharacterized protein (TIGR02996 family)
MAMTTAHDREALLNAIREAPDDDLPRLAFADWLDEHGDEAERARACFIRLQCEADRLRRQSEEDGLPVPAVVKDLEKQADRILRQNKAAFLAGLPVGGGFAIYFRRGMPEYAVPRSAKDFLKRADEAFRVAPIRDVTFSNFTLDELVQVFASGSLRWVEGLHLSGASLHGPRLAGLVRTLSASADVASIRRLSLRAYCVRGVVDLDALVSDLAAGKHWSSLTRLRLVAPGNLSADAVRALGKAKHMPGLRDLILTGSETDEGPSLTAPAVAAIAANFKNLRGLSLGGKSFNDDGVAALVGSKGMSRLRLLEVMGAHRLASPNLLLELLTAPKLAGLAALSLVGPCHRYDYQTRRYLDEAPRAPVSDLASVPPARRCRPPVLRSLQLREHGLRDADAVVLARLPSLRGLVWLNLSDNGIGSEGAAALAAVEWERLTRLDLGGNQIDASGAEALASSPSLARLTHLHLGGNPLGPDGALAIARSPHLGRLEHLNLGSTGLDKKASTELKKRFGRRGWSEGVFDRPRT